MVDQTGLLNRFYDYVKIDTQSDRDSKNSPSTRKQFDLAIKLEEELKALGLDDVSTDEHCYVTATLEGNLFNPNIPVTGFIAHMDTSQDAPGANVKPEMHRKYQGGDLVLSSGVIIKAEDNPSLEKYIGHDIITSDGTTLLGADDKAGIAEIITAIAYLQENPSFKHGNIKVAFTPDEEVGRGTEHFDVKRFGAKYAYTIDGSEVGEIVDENFYAAKAEYRIKGFNTHPGYAKGKLINSQKIAAKLIGILPYNASPETTDGDQGFYHVLNTDGEVGETVIQLIIRDFNKNILETRKNILRGFQVQFNRLYGNGTVELKVENQYLNMKEIIDKTPEVMEVAFEAMKRTGIKPIHKKARGGTDGANLSYMGLPTPDLFDGSINFHSVTEYIPFSSMISATEVLVQIPLIYAERHKNG
jgi:tripeptide aminopeptidase